MATSTVISAAVEGIVDEAVVRKLIMHAGATPGSVHGKQGKSHLRERIAGYNHAAHRAPWLVLVDLDSEADCAPPLRFGWLPQQAPNLCFRVAVREVEAWLLGDAERVAQFLRVARSRIPRDPERLADPKGALVALARSSRLRDVREDMVPRPGSGRQVGPAYSSRLIEFVSTLWRPEEAALYADSLQRTLRCLQRLAEGTA